MGSGSNPYAGTARILTMFVIVNTVIDIICIILAVASIWIPALGGGVRILFIVAACVFAGLDAVYIHVLRKAREDQSDNKD